VLLWTRDHDADDPEVAASKEGGGGGGPHSWRCVARGKHDGPVTDVTVLCLSGAGAVAVAVAGPQGSVAAAAAGEHEWHIIVSTSQDCVVRVWLVDLTTPAAAPAAAAAATAAAPPLALIGTIPLPLKSLPLSTATAWLPGAPRVVMAFGCADGMVRLFLCDPAPAVAAAGAAAAPLESAAVLDGHTDWVRDLAIVADPQHRGNSGGGGASGGSDGGDGSEAAPALGGGLLLASASQDKSTRIWRIAYAGGGGGDVAGSSVAAASGDGEEAPPAFMRLAAPPRPPAVLLGGGRLSVHLEGLLTGHEDWVLSVAWQPRDSDTTAAAAGRPGLLTGSMDRSLILWTPRDSGAGGGAATAGGGGTVWMATTSMGEAAASCLGQDLPDITSHVIQRILDPRYLG